MGRTTGGGGMGVVPRRDFFSLNPFNIANLLGFPPSKKIPIRLQNQSCRPSPVVWEKHRSKWSTRLGSWFFRPHFQIGLSKFCRNKSAQLVIPKSQAKHGNLKKMPGTDCPHLPSPPSVRNTFFEFPLLPYIFVPPLIGLN